MLATLDQSIESVSTEGGFTDMEQPLLKAYEMLVNDGRPEAIKTIVFLSDGQMDPHPTRGTKKDLIEKMERNLERRMSWYLGRGSWNLHPIFRCIFECI